MGQGTTIIQSGFCHCLSDFIASLLGIMGFYLEFYDIIGMSYFDDTSVSLSFHLFFNQEPPHLLGLVLLSHLHSE